MGVTSPDELRSSASENRATFDLALGQYVRSKLRQVMSRLPHGGRQGWFDASGCGWCLFDDERFDRSGEEGRRLREECGDACDLQVYWSMGDVVMPRECDERWVAERIATEASRQLEGQGYACTTEWRDTAEGRHLGVAFARRPFWRR